MVLFLEDDLDVELLLRIVEPPHGAHQLPQDAGLAKQRQEHRIDWKLIVLKPCAWALLAAGKLDHCPKPDSRAGEEEQGEDQHGQGKSHLGRGCERADEEDDQTQEKSYLLSAEAAPCGKAGWSALSWSCARAINFCPKTCCSAADRSTACG